MTTQTPPLEFFNKRPAERCQVRFWSTPDLYKEFTAECDRLELKYGDVFQDFMRWFIKSKDKIVK